METTKRSPGRPKKAPEDLGVKIEIYVSGALLEQVDEAARAEDTTRAEWFRRAARARLGI